MIDHLVFGVFAAITLSSALGVVLFSDPWHSALMLGVTLLSVAVFYVILDATFVAVIQVLVYVGGILILITFAVMLTRRQESPGEAGGDEEVTGS